jgi:hypothetical protein
MLERAVSLCSREGNLKIPDKFWNVEYKFAHYPALYIGHGKAIHLSRNVGVPAIWTLQEFIKKPEYRVYIGAKRTMVQNEWRIRKETAK